MSKREDFAKRWLRRKREAAEAGTPEAAIEPPRDEQVKDEQRATPVPQDDGAFAEVGGFAQANLPSVDSIGADTDIHDFLQPGVPPDLTRKALRTLLRRHRSRCSGAFLSSRRDVRPSVPANRIGSFRAWRLTGARVIEEESQ